MDAFWLIPTGLCVLAFVVLFYGYLRTQPHSPNNPHVLLDKPSEPSVDPDAESKDWDGRPCGSYLEWASKRKES